MRSGWQSATTNYTGPGISSRGAVCAAPGPTIYGISAMESPHHDYGRELCLRSRGQLMSRANRTPPARPVSCNPEMHAGALASCGARRMPLVPRMTTPLIHPETSAASGPLKNRRGNENEGFRARSRRRTGSKSVDFVEDSATLSWRERSVCSPCPVFQRAAGALCRKSALHWPRFPLLAKRGICFVENMQRGMGGSHR